MNAVPCNGCTLCCRGDVITLHPERGDDPASYDTQKLTIPGSGIEVDILKKGPDGNCIYLGEGGCTIYERRPAICRTFDCRDWFRRTTRTQRRILVKRGLADQAILDRGRELLPTLKLSETF